MGSMSEQPGRYQRSFAGMIGAMVVLVLVVGAFVVFRNAVREEPGNPVEAVEIERPVEYARSEADFDLLAPDELPDGWIATSVRFTRGEEQGWHLGLLTDEERYVGLEQSPRPATDVVEEFVDEEATEGDEVTVGGESWQSWTDAEDDLALVREDGDVTTLVVGRVQQETLEELIATLR
jgi:hypothetical protein